MNTFLHLTSCNTNNNYNIYALSFNVVNSKKFYWPINIPYLIIEYKIMGPC